MAGVLLDQVHVDPAQVDLLAAPEAGYRGVEIGDRSSVAAARFQLTL